MLQSRRFHNDPLGGIAMLQDTDRVFAIFDFQCYVQALSGNRWVIWYHTGPANSPKALRVSIFDPTLIAAIENPLETAVQMRSRNERILIDGEPLALFDVPCDFAAGSHHVAMDDAFKAVPELLMYSHSTALGPVRYDKGDSTLLQINPRDGKVTVYPQPWFNDGAYDFGYQWPCVVAREPKSQIVVGYGIRLGTYAYVPSLEDVVWLHANAFAGWPG